VVEYLAQNPEIKGLNPVAGANRENVEKGIYLEINKSKVSKKNGGGLKVQLPVMPTVFQPNLAFQVCLHFVFSS